MTWRIGGLRMIPLTALCFVLAGGSLGDGSPQPSYSEDRSDSANARRARRHDRGPHILRVRPWRSVRVRQASLRHQTGADLGVRIGPNRNQQRGEFSSLLARSSLRPPRSEEERSASANVRNTRVARQPDRDLGYVFGVRGMYSLSQSAGMALPTAIALLVLGIGIIFAVTDRGVPALSDWTKGRPAFSRAGCFPPPCSLR